jgi:transaldolase
MKFFVDTADTKEIRALAASGLVDGVTTNPSLIAKSGRKILEVIAEICEVVPGPVSAEVAATEYEQIMREAAVLRRIAKNVTIKVPLTPDGLRACKALSSDGAMVNVTLCFSAAQALLAAKAGATFISPFVGRLDDIGYVGMDLIADIVQIYKNYDYLKTEVLVASVRSPLHVIDAAKIGAHVATLPPAVLRSLYVHPLTEKGLTTFLADWAKTGQHIEELKAAAHS